MDTRTHEIEERLRAVARGVLEGFLFELVDLSYTVEHGRRILRLYIDKPGGVTLDDCADASRALSTTLDVEDVIKERYNLEVSSPGLDRPLKTIKDFERFAGAKAKVRTKAPIQGRRNFMATIQGVSGCKVLMRDADARQWEIDISDIDKARLEPDLGFSKAKR